MGGGAHVRAVLPSAPSVPVGGGGGLTTHDAPPVVDVSVAAWATDSFELRGVCGGVGGMSSRGVDGSVAPLTGAGGDDVGVSSASSQGITVQRQDGNENDNEDEMVENVGSIPLLSYGQ